MKLFAALAALAITIGTSLAPASARTSYVIDNAHLFSQTTVDAINQKVGDFNAQTRKEVVVITDTTRPDGDANAFLERTFAQNQINGVLIYIAKSPKTISVVPDRASHTFFPSGSTSAIRTAIQSAFNSGNFDGGITNGVDLTLSEYRSHMSSLRTNVRVPNREPATSRSDATGGFHMSWIVWLVVLAVIFFIVRGIFRAMSAPRMMPPGYGGGPGYGGPGYGGGYGGGGFGGGGGGGFFSGLLGGLGGAFLGNELFGRRDEGSVGGTEAGFGGEGGGVQPDNSGWQSDAGQADIGNSSTGGWGDSGGGDSGGGWGGGDSGGGDSGGGW